MEHDIKDTKHTIYQAATTVFSAKGFEQASVDDIAHEANIAKGTIYYHFTSKDDILLNLLEDGILHFTQTIRSHIDPQKPVEEQLKSLISAQVNYFVKYQDFCKIFLTELWRLESRWKKNIAIIQEQYLTILKEVIQRGRGTGQFRDDLPLDALTISSFSLISMTSLDWVIFHTDRPICDIVDTITELLMNGIKTPFVK